MKRTLLSLTLIAAAWSMSTEAANLHQDKALANEALSTARNYRFDRGAFMSASLKLQLIENDLRDLAPSADKAQIIHAINSAQFALRNHRASDFEKVSAVESAVRIILSSLDDLIRYDRDYDDGFGRDDQINILDTLNMMQRVQNQVSRNEMIRASRLVNRIQRILSRYPMYRDRDLMMANRALLAIEQKLSDHYASLAEKIHATNFNARIFDNSVTRSDAYRDARYGRDRDRSPRPLPPRHPGGGRGAQEVTVLCSSWQDFHTRCSVGGFIRSVVIRSQQSNSPCLLNRSWGYDANSIWVSQGCRAEFRVTLSD